MTGLWQVLKRYGNDYKSCYLKNILGLDLYHYAPAFFSEGDEYLQYFELEDLAEYQKFIEQHKSFIAVKDFEEFGKSEVIYFFKKGYQRKGMNKRFYSQFKNDGVYLDLASVLRAYHYLEADIRSLEELQNEFKINFIDNFVEGESIFFVSW